MFDSTGHEVLLPQTPSFSLEGRRALVTGGSRGIGLAVATALSDAGAAVTLAARSYEGAERVASALRERGGNAQAIKLDVSDIQSIDASVGAALKPGQVFDVLVNNAGINRPAPFVSVTPDDFEAIMNVNVRGAFFVAQAVARRLIERERPGSIIHMSSQMGHVGAPLRTAYCASKHAIQGLMKSMAVELGVHGIRVNAVCPTFVETQLTAAQFESQEFRTDVVSRIKLGRVGRVEDIMGAVLYLAGDASALVTGAALTVDGGWTAE